MKNKRKFQGAAVDSFLLTVVKIMTAIIGIIVSKILSVSFSLKEYGTYSQVLLVVSTTTSITILGLADATNFYFNSQTEEERKSFISTIFCLQYIMGFLGCAVLCLLSRSVCSFFNNNDLFIYIFIISLMPMINNMLSMLHVLFVSIGKAKLIAVRNLIVSILNLTITCVSAYLLKNIMIVLLLQGIATLVQVVYFMFLFMNL